MTHADRARKARTLFIVSAVALVLILAIGSQTIASHQSALDLAKALYEPGLTRHERTTDLAGRLGWAWLVTIGLTAIAGFATLHFFLTWRRHHALKGTQLFA